MLRLPLVRSCGGVTLVSLNSIDHTFVPYRSLTFISTDEVGVATLELAARTDADA